MTRVLLAVPSYRGISDAEAMALVDGKALIAAGLEVRPYVARGLALIDYARNALLAMAYHLSVDFTLYQDDDARTGAASVREMIRLAETYGFDVLAAPVQMRGSGAPNFGPDGPPMAMDDGSIVQPIAWTGLGSVLVSRRATAALVEACKDRHYRANPTSPLWRLGRPREWNVFRSDTVPSRDLDPAAPEAEQEFLGDDRVFSYLLRKCGIVMRAYLNARTNHADMGEFCVADRRTT